MTPLLLRLATAAVLAALPQSPRQSLPSAPQLLIECTPTTVAFVGQEARPARNPIAEALAAAGPGTLIRLRPGDYPAFGIGFHHSQHWNARTSGGAPGRPVVVKAEGGRVRVVPEDRGDTLSINQAVPNGHITFEGIEFVPDYRAAIFFFKLDGGGVHRGYRFLDCDIVGSWDHASNTGGNSKWGVWGHSMADFVFAGRTRPARVRNLRYEHGFYIQNPKGDITLENIQAAELGRTFCQFTSRAGDGPPGTGTIAVRRCVVSDVGLSRDDNFKGGTAFTFAGRHRGEILVENNRYSAGFDPKLRRLTHGGAPYGTGALVAWDGGGGEKTRSLFLQGNDFRFAPGCGDRPVVAIGGCEQVRIVGQNRFQAGADRVALALDPLSGGPGSPPASVPNGSVVLARETQIEGQVTLGGRPLSKEEVEGLLQARR